MSVTKQTKVNDRIIPDGISRPETYLNGHPVIGGIGDPRMGTCDFRARCKTCDCTYVSMEIKSELLWTWYTCTLDRMY